MSAGNGPYTRQRPLHPSAIFRACCCLGFDKPDEPVLWESKIELGEKFFNEIINHPVPLDMNTLTALKRCSLGLDLYLWLWSTAPSRFVLRSSSPGCMCTVSSARIQTTRPRMMPSKTSVAASCES